MRAKRRSLRDTALATVAARFHEPGRRVFRLADYLERLHRSANAIGIARPMSLNRLEDLALQTATAFDRDESYVRLLITRGIGPPGIHLKTCERPGFIFIVGGLAMFPETVRNKGLRLMTGRKNCQKRDFGNARSTGKSSTVRGN